MVDIFEIIDDKLVEIMDIIEQEMPLLMKDIPYFINQKIENEKLYNIYLTISKLRNI